MSDTNDTGVVMVVFIARCSCKRRSEGIYIDPQTEGTQFHRATEASIAAGCCGICGLSNLGS